MILELLIGAGLVAAGAAAARIAVRRRDAEEEDPIDGDTGEKTRSSRKSKKQKAKAKAQSGPRGLLVGDVLLYADSEFWLAGCIELDEEGFVARVFSSPGGGRAEYVIQLDDRATDIVTASVTDEVPEGPVPEALPIDGRRLQLEARGTASVRSWGDDLPRTSKSATYTLLSGVGGRVLLVLDFAKAPRVALVGDRVGRHMIDLLPGGDIEDEDP